MNDHKWFEEHLEELKEKFDGKLVAVLNGNVIAVGDDLQEVAREIERLKESGKVQGTPFTGRVGDDVAAVHIPIAYV